MVSTAKGASAYSKVIKVNVVKEQGAGDPPEITTTKLPDAIEGKSYYVKLSCTDGDAVFTEYYNPGKDNQLQDSGLYITQHGELEGKPTKAGTYTFTICAAGEGGEGYATYTLVVKEAKEDTTEPTQDPTEATTEKPDKADKGNKKDNNKQDRDEEEDDEKEDASWRSYLDDEDETEGAEYRHVLFAAGQAPEKSCAA